MSDKILIEILNEIKDKDHTCSKEGDISAIKEKSLNLKETTTEIKDAVLKNKESLDKIAGGISLVKFLGVGFLVTFVVQSYIVTQRLGNFHDGFQDVMKQRKIEKEFSMLMSNRNVCEIGDYNGNEIQEKQFSITESEDNKQEQRHKKQ